MHTTQKTWLTLITTVFIVGAAGVTTMLGFDNIDKTKALINLKQKHIQELAIFKAPLTANILHDSEVLCSRHGDIEAIARIGYNKYNLQCKDGSWFLNVGLEPLPKKPESKPAIKPVVLTSQVIK